MSHTVCIETTLPRKVHPHFLSLPLIAFLCKGSVYVAVSKCFTFTKVNYEKNYEDLF